MYSGSRYFASAYFTRTLDLNNINVSEYLIKRINTSYYSGAKTVDSRRIIASLFYIYPDGFIKWILKNKKHLFEDGEEFNKKLKKLEEQIQQE